MNKEINTSQKKGMGMRFFTHLIVFCFLFQVMLPAYAVALSSGQIQQVLDSIAEIEFSSGNGSYQYTVAPYIDTTSQRGFDDIEGFYNRLKDEHIESLGEVTYVPIGVSDITTFIPVYENPKLVGDSFVQSRYVRDQIHELLGRHLIDSDHAQGLYKDEATQLKTLYDNAYLYASAANTSEIYGDPIPASKFDRESSPYDMIWPERRVIRGETVVVPVVYLSADTISKYKVTNHRVQLNGNASFGGITLHDVDIKTGRKTFLEVAGHFTSENSSISACNLSIVVGGSLRLLSSQVDATCGDLTIVASSIEAKTLVHQYDLGDETGGFFGEVTSISAKGNLSVRSHSDIVLNGVTINAGDHLTFAANGNIEIGGVPLTSSFDGKQGRWYIRKSGVSYLQSKLTAEETIQLIAGGQIALNAAEISSDQGHIELLAGLGITIEDELETTESYRKGKFGKKKIEESVYQTVAIRSLLDAGKNIRLHSDFGDITLKAADIKSGLGTEVNASGGKVNLLLTTETDHYSYSSVKKGLFTITTKNKGHVIENAVPNTIVGGFTVKALRGVSVEYEGDPNLSLDEQVQVLSQFEGMEWMAQVRADFPDADWTAIELQYEKWNESNTSITPAFAAVISIAMAVVTGGAGAAALTWVDAAIAAGMAALETQFVIALANGLVNGDVAGSMEDMASSDTLKSIAVSMVTAGALAKIDATFFKIDSAKVQEAADNARKLAEAGNSTAAQIQQAVADAINKASKLSLKAQALQAVSHATVGAGVKTLVTGHSFEEGFTLTLGQYAASSIGEVMANEIKGAWDGPQATNIDTAIKYIAHAGAGCIIGAAKSDLENNSGEKGCQAGALGGVVGEIIADVNKSLSQVSDDVVVLEQYLAERGLVHPAQLTLEQRVELLSLVDDPSLAVNEMLELQKQGIDLAKLGGALSAFVSGADASQVYIASDAAENAAENNALFLIPIAIALLKAADLAFTLKELHTLYVAWASGEEGAFREALLEWGGEAAVEKLIGLAVPGAKTFSEFAKKLADMGVIPQSVLKKVEETNPKPDNGDGSICTRCEGHCCFVAGTQVVTKDGFKAIETIEIGDLVLSKDVDSGQQGWKPVTQLFTKYRQIFDVVVESDASEASKQKLIETTDDHPFYVQGKGWVATIDLKPGDKIETDETSVAVVKTVRASNRNDTTYNLEVADFHTYYVTKLKLLVHNCDDLPKPRLGDRRISNELYEELRKKTPTQELKDQVNVGKIPPYPDEALPGFTVLKKLEADHIVPMARIAKMEGFDKLSKEQQLSILNFPDNFIGSSRSANASRGDKTYSEWWGHKDSNTPVNPAFKAKMIPIETNLERVIQKKIDDFKNGSDS
ncbi:polymorphic toxin-type HINT domain-containing protein [Microbulbifer sp. DLAB2-AF]|uniref:polymorphic toxin-type HINT domain-containing protein n=1 Tax=Microbulbifer sp. DLAB2-AF TaxID=3243395 RepID=UPI004039EF78